MSWSVSAFDMLRKFRGEITDSDKIVPVASCRRCAGNGLVFLRFKKGNVMKMKIGDSNFGAPVGTYVAEFLGVTPFNNGQKVGRDGKPMGPAVEWKFAIVEDPDHAGEFIGREVSRITSEKPTAANACGQLLSGLVGRALAKGEEIDLAAYEGRHFRVTVAPAPDNPERTRVILIAPLKTSEPSTSANSTLRKPPPQPGAKKLPSRQ